MKYYIVTKNIRDFITFYEKENYFFKGYVGNIWAVSDDIAQQWSKKVEGQELSYQEAQNIINIEIQKAQEDWDNDKRDEIILLNWENDPRDIIEKGPRPVPSYKLYNRPENIILIS